MEVLDRAMIPVWNGNASRIGGQRERKVLLREGTYGWIKASKSKSTSGLLEPISMTDMDGDGDDILKVGGESGG